MTAQDITLALQAAPQARHAQGIKAIRSAASVGQVIPANKADHALDLTFVIPLAGTTEAFLE